MLSRQIHNITIMLHTQKTRLAMLGQNYNCLIYTPIILSLQRKIENSSSEKTNSLSNVAKLIGNSPSEKTNSLGKLAKLIGNNSSEKTNSLSNLAKLIGNSSSEKQIH